MPHYKNKNLEQTSSIGEIRESAPLKCSPRIKAKYLKKHQEKYINDQCYKLAHLFTRKGNISKRWYVRFYLKKPDGSWKEEREYISMKIKDRASRKLAGIQIRDEINRMLISGELTYERLYQLPPDSPRGDQRLIPLLDQILQDIKKDIEPKTFNGYNSAANKFKAWISLKEADQILLENFTKDLAKMFYEDLTRSGLSNNRANTIKSMLSAILSRTDHNPFAGIKSKKKEEPRVYCWDLQDLKSYMSHCKKEDPDLYLASLLIFHCFIRPIELTRIKKQDLILEKGILLVDIKKGVSNKKAPASLSKELIQLLKEKVKDLKEDSFLFSTGLRPGEIQVNMNRFGDRFRAAKKEIQFNRSSAVLYELKHTGVSLAAEKGVPIHNIKNQCRHSSVTTTEIYLKRISNKIDKHFERMIDFDSLAEL